MDGCDIRSHHFEALVETIASWYFVIGSFRWVLGASGIRSHPQCSPEVFKKQQQHMTMTSSFFSGLKQLASINFPGRSASAPILSVGCRLGGGAQRRGGSHRVRGEVHGAVQGEGLAILALDAAKRCLLSCGLDLTEGSWKFNVPLQLMDAFDGLQGTECFPSNPLWLFGWIWTSTFG